MAPQYAFGHIKHTYIILFLFIYLYCREMVGLLLRYSVYSFILFQTVNTSIKNDKSHFGSSSLMSLRAAVGTIKMDGAGKSLRAE